MALIDIHIHGNFDEIERKLNKILSSITLIHKEMPTKAEFQQALADVTAALENIAADITRLTDQLSQGGLTDAEEQEIFTELRAVADRANSIAATTPEPEPPAPEA